jgi:hypothetical protein
LGWPNVGFGWWRQQPIRIEIGFGWWRQQPIRIDIGFGWWRQQPIRIDIGFGWWRHQPIRKILYITRILLSGMEDTGDAESSTAWAGGNIWFRLVETPTDKGRFL